MDRSKSTIINGLGCIISGSHTVLDLGDFIQDPSPEIIQRFQTSGNSMENSTQKSGFH